MRVLVLTLLLLAACGPEGSHDSDRKGSSEKKSDSAKVLPQKEIDKLNSLIGKYPNQVNLFEQDQIKGRLQSVLGNKYENFIENWNTETPIVKKGNVLHTSGCKAHDCAANSYDLFLDLKSNIINIYHIKNGKEKVYKEHDTEIVLPEDFAAEMKVKRQNSSLEALPPPRLH